MSHVGAEILDRKDAQVVKEIDISVKNKWNWTWLEKKLVVDIGKILPKTKWTKGPVDTALSDFVRKVLHGPIQRDFTSYIQSAESFNILPRLHHRAPKI